MSNTLARTIGNFADGIGPYVIYDSNDLDVGVEMEQKQGMKKIDGPRMHISACALGQSVWELMVRVRERFYSIHSKLSSNVSLIYTPRPRPRPRKSINMEKQSNDNMYNRDK